MQHSISESHLVLVIPDLACSHAGRGILEQYAEGPQCPGWLSPGLSAYPGADYSL
jgi:hypothetical protein